MVAEQEAKQLDSVTDVVKDTDLDESKAQQAMTTLASGQQEEASNAAALAAISVSKKDIALIVSELDVTEDMADRILREVGVESGEDTMLEKALRRLVTAR